MATSGKVIKCRAAVAWGPNRPLVMEEIEVSPPEAHEIRIKIVVTAVCHTDLHFLRERDRGEGFPAVLGHEGAGTVESVGPGVTRFKPGDTVVPLFVSQCRECRFCRNPDTNQCEKSWSSQRSGKRLEVSSDTTSRLKCRGQTLLQYMGTSTFSEYTVVKEIASPRFPTPRRSTKPVCWAVELPRVMVPLSTLQRCSLALPAQCSDKFPKAKVCGATDFVNPKDYDKPISKVLAEMTNGGVDFALECVGNVDVMKSALESCVKGWGVSVLAGYNDNQDVSTRCLQFLAGRTLKGTLFGGYKSVDSVPKLVSDVMSGKLQLDEFVTKTLPLDQINDAFDLLAKSEGVRTVLTVSTQ
ncbi:hypothetical protein GJAV_G00067140 [Gymnothorax javanicus]|nr:hypothetical protein GJAV_G00067140 [Gymnothorax javanicus]